MAARFAAVDETTPTRMPALKSTATDHQSATTAPQAEPEAWNSQIAQVKR
jgi:hypothetical protein